MDDDTYKSYRDANAGRRASVFDTKALSKMKQSVSSGVKTAAESASTGVKNATETGIYTIIYKQYFCIFFCVIRSLRQLIYL